MLFRKTKFCCDYRRKFSWLYLRKQNQKRRMNGLRKRKKFSVVQLFARTRLTHRFLFYLRTESQLNLRLYARKIYASVEINL